MSIEPFADTVALAPQPIRHTGRSPFREPARTPAVRENPPVRVETVTEDVYAYAIIAPPRAAPSIMPEIMKLKLGG